MEATSLQGSELQLDEIARDRVLVQRVQAGDREAFADLYDAYERRVFARCLRICANPDDAADATHEAFATVLRRLPELGEVRNFGGYLFEVARTAALRVIKRNSKTMPRADLGEWKNGEPIAAEEDPERALLLSEQQRHVLEASHDLAPRQREALLLTELKGLSYMQVGEELHTSRSAVAQLVFRARMRLREAIRAASVARPLATADCREALPLMSRRLDGELDTGGAEWLDGHLASCGSCKANLEALEEAGAIFRSVGPWLAGPVLAEELFDDDRRAVAVADWLGGDAAAHVAGSTPRAMGRVLAHPATQAVPADTSGWTERAAAAGAAIAILIGGAIVARLPAGPDTPGTSRVAKPPIFATSVLPAGAALQRAGDAAAGHARSRHSGAAGPTAGDRQRDENTGPATPVDSSEGANQPDSGGDRTRNQPKGSGDHSDAGGKAPNETDQQPSQGSDPSGNAGAGAPSAPTGAGSEGGESPPSNPSADSPPDEGSPPPYSPPNNDKVLPPYSPPDTGSGPTPL